jgi:hypothetical protein
MRLFTTMQDAPALDRTVFLGSSKSEASLMPPSCPHFVQRDTATVPLDDLPFRADVPRPRRQPPSPAIVPRLHR